MSKSEAKVNFPSSVYVTVDLTQNFGIWCFVQIFSFLLSVKDFPCISGHDEAELGFQLFGSGALTAPASLQGPCTML